jgi:hypothetical protein
MSIQSPSEALKSGLPMSVYATTGLTFIPINVFLPYDHTKSPGLVNQKNDFVFSPVEDPFPVLQLFVNTFSQLQGLT